MGPSVLSSATPGDYQPGVALADLQLIVAQTPPAVWAALRQKKLFITGGTGFVGCWLLEALLWADHTLALGLDLTVLSRNPGAFAVKAPHLAGHRALRLVQGNTADLAAVDGRFDMLIHAATDVAKPNGDARTTYQDMVDGTAQALALAERCQAERFLLISSGAVYGRQPTSLERVAEAYRGAPDCLDPGTAYGQGKRVSEWLTQCHAARSTTKVSIARCFALVGPYLPLDAHFALGNFIGDGLAGRPITVNSDGRGYRSYLYGADMSVWLLTILVNGAAGESYNVGSENAVTIGQTAELVSTLAYGSCRVSRQAATSTAAPDRYVPCTDKARTSLHLAEYTSLTAAIEKTVSWAASQHLRARKSMEM